MTDTQNRPVLPEGLYAIIDDASFHAPLFLVRAALRGGARVVQLRFKKSGSRALVEVARAALPLCHAAGALLFLNDRPDLVCLVGADGVHLGQGDLPLAEARRILGSRPLLGLSTHSDAEIDAALALGADCIGFGPVFATSTKSATGSGAAPLPDPVGIAGLSRAAARARGTPVIAIGGITESSAAAIGGAGAHCLATISAICHKADPEQAARALLQGFMQGRTARIAVLSAAAAASRSSDPHVA